MPEESSPFSVKEYIAELNAKLSTVFGDVVGEVSEVKKHGSGHVYFTIKDKDSVDTLPCAIWRSRYAMSSVEIEVGMELLVKGRPNYYGPHGKLSFIADSVQLVGEGALLKAYEKLKKKLEEEGIFEPSKKKPLPAYPHRIGVVTSVHGAVIHDFNNNLKKYGFKVRIRDTRVEGPESGKDITLAVRAFREEDIDVLVILRGGGSIQSLAGFDNEALVREIASFPTPVIAGLGHHQDVPLAALAADAMESTPSLVAELLNESWSTAQYSLQKSESIILRSYEYMLSSVAGDLDRTYIRIERALEHIFDLYTQTERTIRDGLTKIGYAIGQSKREMEGYSKTILSRFGASTKYAKSEYLVKTPVRLIALFGARVKGCSTYLQQMERLIETNNPERQLKLGYSLAFAEGKVIKSSKDLTKCSALSLRFADGGAETIIKEIT